MIARNISYAVQIDESDLVGCFNSRAEALRWVEGDDQGVQRAEADSTVIILPLLAPVSANPYDDD